MSCEISTTRPVQPKRVHRSDLPPQWYTYATYHHKGTYVYTYVYTYVFGCAPMYNLATYGHKGTRRAACHQFACQQAEQLARCGGGVTVVVAYTHMCPSPTPRNMLATVSAISRPYLGQISAISQLISERELTGAEGGA
mmetsp:Transcript_22206/g.44677  ORF Transcript_22206/g.44677 Transcript_22206/m.44677 type:complete len:139 (+) Transcript_22206:765-1181(+)